MQSRRAIQVGFVIVIAGVVAFIFLVGKNNPTATLDNKPGQKPVNEQPASGFNFELYEKDMIGKLPKKDQDEIMIMLGRLKGRGAMDENLLVLAQKYEKLHLPALAGYYYNKLAGLEPNNENVWFEAGKNYFDAEQAVDDQDKLNYFIEMSYNSLAKVIDMDPDRNLEAMTDQGVNILEKSMNHTLGGPPMQGIGLLMKVVQADSNNRKALNYLGLFSMQSGQFDRAIMRFKHLTSLPPDNDANYPYYYRYLAQAYIETGKREEAVSSLEKYKSLVKEQGLKQEADSIIHSIQ